MLASPVDTLGRFKRYRTQRPRGKLIRKSPELIELLAFLYRHGPLPTKILFEFHGTRSDKMFAGYLSRLYDGVCTKQDEHVFEDGKDVTLTANRKHTHSIIQQYLDRPRDYRTANLYYDQIVHDLTAEAHTLLDAHGQLSTFVHRTDPDVHRLMGACITASIELAVRTGSGEFIHRHRVLSKKGHKLRINALAPDELFGITAGVKQRFFVCEWDRATEALTSTSTSRETIRTKLADYQHFIRERTYSKAWGIENCRILFATVGATRMQNVLDLIKSEYPYLASRVFCKTFPEFAGRDWTIPKSAYRDILTGWKNANQESFDLI